MCGVADIGNARTVIGAVIRFACNKGFSVMQDHVRRRRPPVRTTPVSAAVRFPYTRLSSAVL